MRTTIVLDDKLVAEAREVLGPRTLRAMLETALREAVKARQRQMLIDVLNSGALALTITDQDLKQMRGDRPMVPEWVGEGQSVPGGGVEGGTRGASR